MQQLKVTLRDVAAHAGVHPATASRALSEATRHRVNVETARRVAAAAHELGYEPDLTARTMRTGRTATAAVLIPDLTNPLFPPIVRGIEDTLAERDFTALIANTDNDPTREQTHFDALLSRQVDGFIFATAREDDIGRLMIAIDGIATGLARIVTQVRSASADMSDGTGRIAAGSSDISLRIATQASSLEETAASMEQLTATVKQNSENARQASGLAQPTANPIARHGIADLAADGEADPDRRRGVIGGDRGCLQHKTGHGAAPTGLDAEKIPTIGQPSGARLRGGRGQVARPRVSRGPCGGDWQ